MKESLSVLLHQKPSQEIISVSPDCTLCDCIDLMNAKQVGSVVILDNGKLLGMFTERDILRRLGDKSIDFKQAKVSDVMSTEIVIANPDTTVEEAMMTFTRRRFRHLPVIENDKVIGIISIGDVTKWVIENQQHEIEHLAEYISGRY